MKFLLDTNIISELRKKTRANPGVTEWFNDQDEESLYLSSLVLGEVRMGIERLRLRDPQAAGLLDIWISKITHQFDSKILCIDEAVSEIWGRINVPDPLPPIDGLLAATAIAHDMTLVTRNVQDMERSGVRLLNPFSS